MSIRAYVYVAAWRKEGPVKIGVTHAPVARLAQLQTGLPYRLRIWGAAYVKSAGFVEKECHAQLEAHVMMGEWFNSSVMASVRVLRSAASQMDNNWHWWVPAGKKRA